MKTIMKQKKKILTILILTGACSLVAAAALAAGHEGGAMSRSLSPEKLKDLLWRVLNFIALMVILITFLRKPLANALKGRQQAIADQFEGLESRKAEAEQLYKRYESKLAKIDQEVSAILDNARKQAETEKERIIADAHRAAEDLKRQAGMAVQHELAAARKQLRNDVVEQAAAMAEELLRKNLHEDDQTNLVNSYLDRVGGIQ